MRAQGSPAAGSSWQLPDLTGTIGARNPGLQVPNIADGSEPGTVQQRSKKNMSMPQASRTTWSGRGSAKTLRVSAGSEGAQPTAEAKLVHRLTWELGKEASPASIVFEITAWCACGAASGCPCKPCHADSGLPRPAEPMAC